MNLLLVGNLQSNLQANPTVCDELVQVFSSQGWHVVSTSRQSNKILKLADMLFTCMLHRREFDIALIDVYSTLAFIWAEAASTLLRRLGKPYVLTLHGGNLPALANRQPKRLMQLLSGSKWITTPSEYLQSQMRVFRDDIRLIPNPLDISRYKFIQREHVKPILVWLRAFHRIYNPCLALQVMDLLKEKIPDIHLNMVGPDKHDGSLEEFRREMLRLGLEKRVSILGGVPKAEVPAVLQRGDIFINTTRVDNTPVSVLGSMGCGLCIVSTNVGGIPYMLDHKKNALLVPTEDPHAMAEAISLLFNTPMLAKEISLGARKKIEQKDIKQTIQLWESLFMEIQHG